MSARRAIEEVALGIAQVRARWHVSARTVSRWVQNRASGFPAPFYVNGRRRWWLRDLEAWEATRCGRPAELTNRAANLRGSREVVR